ncbi:hypothetical protein BN946_scf184908.g114 [Trametes cinnabarina]|uniref:Uncharacterized protein n=1 Tax=Pycnoporus cinnabarinus TaxID=5643 RepID=A0A060SAX9_PYCCI|nr:hypothetical protein BN946_scf184908.g114 [Trametes cinnabarina]
MLSTNVTPRPPPPSRARKANSMHFSQLAPPPPYTPPLSEVMLDSPIHITAHLVTGAALSPDGPSPPRSGSMEEWVEEKSREELSGLLLKADDIIKTRETELSYTSSLCKSLYDDNVALKSKHEALIARLPGTGVTSPAPSAPASPRLNSSTAGRSSSFTGVMFPASSEESLQPLPPAFRMRHHRRISVTPAELANLADQNAELMEKLEKLETESFKADQAGKRKLRKLEQEIQSLREELDKTQAKGAELEEQAKAAANAAHVQFLKEEREAWRRAVKEKSASQVASDISGAEVRDFAPPSEFSRKAPRRRLYIASESSDPDISGSSSDASASFEHASFATDVHHDGDASGHASFFSDPSLHDVRSFHAGTEFALISQLLSKVQELEETNTQIIEQQKLTEERMRAAQWDADSIRRVYDCLDVADIDIEDPEQPVPPPRSQRVASGSTVRFSSLRRTLIGDSSRLLSSEESVDFAGGISREMQSTVREEPGGPKGGVGHKTRKSVVGLFDREPQADAGWDDIIPSLGDYPPSLKVSSSFGNVARTTGAADRSTWSNAATDGLALPSPTSTALQTPTEGPLTGRTLGSELGSELGEEWPERGYNHHLRASSLYDLAGLNTSQSLPGSPAESHAPPSFALPSGQDQSYSEDVAGPSTPPRAPALQLNIEPPTPTPDRLRSPAAQRQQRLSQTMRARTHRWVEGRFQQDASRENVLRKPQSSSTLGRRFSMKGKMRAELTGSRDGSGILNETFDDAVLHVKRARNRASLAKFAFPPSSSAAPQHSSESPVEEEQSPVDADRSVELRRPAADPVKREGFVGFVLEAWLWLQFAIVVMLFLWAMAKRGPKVVLEAERRGAHSGGGQ